MYGLPDSARLPGAVAALHAPSMRQAPPTQLAVMLPALEPKHTPEQVVPSLNSCLLELLCLLEGLLQVSQPMYGPGRSLQAAAAAAAHNNSSMLQLLAADSGSRLSWALKEGTARCFWL